MATVVLVTVVTNVGIEQKSGDYTNHEAGDWVGVCSKESVGNTFSEDLGRGTKRDTAWTRFSLLFLRILV